MASKAVTTGAVFVDFDLTLCKIYFWQGLFEHHRQLRFKRKTLYSFLAFHMPIWLLTKAKLVQKSYFQRIWITNSAWLVKDVSINRANQIWDWVIEHQIIPQLRPELIDAINEHKENGRRIFILSGSFEPFIERLAMELNLDGFIATPLESNNGLYTGKVEQPLCIGHGKLERLQRFLVEQDGKEIDLSKSYFYTDSAADVPVMEKFGHPIAVYPDNELAKISSKNKWEII